MEIMGVYTWRHTWVLSLVFLHVLQPMPSQIKANGTPPKKSLCQRSWVIHPLILFVILMVLRLNSWVTNLTLNPEVFTFVFFWTVLSAPPTRTLLSVSAILWGTYNLIIYHPRPFPPPLGSVHRHLHASSINSGGRSRLSEGWPLLTLPPTKKRRDAVAFKVNVLCECFF